MAKRKPVVEVEADATVEEKASAVETAAQSVADAQSVVDEALKAAVAAEAVLAAAKVEHEQAVQAAAPPPPTPEYGKHILVQFGGTNEFVLRDAPPEWNRERTLLLDGVNVEHVSDDPNGVWCYRQM